MRWMSRSSLLVLAGLLALAGCQGSDSSRRNRIAPSLKKGAEQMRIATEPDTVPATNAPSAPVVLPTSGRVHSVNLGLRFVVIDYTLGGMPPLQSLLNVYRNNQKVGEVRLYGFERNGFVTADIVEGFIQVDDEVRVN